MTEGFTVYTRIGDGLLILYHPLWMLVLQSIFVCPKRLLSIWVVLLDRPCTIHMTNTEDYYQSKRIGGAINILVMSIKDFSRASDQSLLFCMSRVLHARLHMRYIYLLNEITPCKPPAIIVTSIPVQVFGAFAAGTLPLMGSWPCRSGLHCWW